MRKMVALGSLIAIGFLGVIGALSTVSLEASEVRQIEITVSPSTLILDSQGMWVTVHTDIPYSQVETLSLQLNGIAVAWTKYDARGYLVGKFNIDTVKSIVNPPEAVLTLTGQCVDGTALEGTDIVRVSAGSRK